MFCNFCENFENSKWPPFLARQNFFENWHGYSADIPCGSKISSKSLYLALPELLPTPPSTHTSLQLEKHYIGCQLSTVLSLRLPCWYISSYTVVTPNTLNPSSFPDIVHITLVEVNLMAYFLRFPTLVQFSSLENILDSVLRMTHL